MGCPSCGAENRPGRRFCGACGTALSAACPSCAFDNEPDEKFCGGCGRRMASPAVETPQTASGQATPAPQGYTPRHLAEKILAGREALQGERKQITVLFADVVGSTDLIRDRDPEEAQRLLDGAVQQMMTAVHRYEGTVSRLQGDGLMAMFGAPVAHEDHAVRACFAALAMLEGIRDYAEAVRTSHGAAIQIRVGLNSGEVIVRLISDDLHMDYTAMGQTVHLASRLEGLANAGTVLLSPSTLALAEGLIDVRPLGPTTVKGLEQPVDVYELNGASMARTRLQAAAARGLTPFVGRQEERAAIERALARARAGHGQVVVLVAEAGIGKSRLVWEATHSDHASGFTVLQTGALSYGRTMAWLPVSNLLRHYFEIESRDDHAAMRAKVIGGVQALDPALAPDLPALLSLLDVPADDDAWTVLDPPRRRAATLDAVRRLVLRESQERPLLLVFEDLHWIDAETQALLDSLVESMAGARLLLLVNYRPEYTHTWNNESYYTQLRIDPLAQANAEEMLDGALGDDPTVQPLKDILISRTEGNPFFLEESFRSLVEIGALIGVRGAYRLTRPVENIRVPATVQAVLAARIDRLPPGDKRLLQTAAVVGKDVPLALLQRVAGLSEEELRGGLGRLRGAELMYEVLPEAGYAFKHALTHEVAYGSLLQSRRCSLHGQIVAAIESLDPDRLDEHVERLADHAVRGERWEQALDYCRRAGRRDLARSALREAGAWFEQALIALRQVPESRDALEQRIDLSIELRNAINPLGEFHRTFEYLRESERLAEQIEDRARLGRVYISMNGYLYLTGKPRRALELNQRALQIARDLGDVALEVAVRQVLGMSYWWLGEFPEASVAFRAALEMAGDETERGRMLLGNSQLLSASAHGHLAWCLAELGELTDAVEHGETAVVLATEAGHTFSQIGTSLQLGLARVRKGDLDEGILVLERGLEISRVSGFRTLAYFGVASYLGEAYVAAGRLTDAVLILEDVVNRGRALNAISDYLLAMGPLAEAYAELGRLEEALALVVDAVELASRHGFRALEAHALRYLGALHAWAERFDAEISERCSRQALALAEELEMRPLQAHCHLGLGKLYRRVGRLDEARAELSTAVAMLREMEMTFWLREAEAERLIVA